jgi:deazaflavin-dependent oxidoreductase (nitroreductase family)
MPKHLANRRRLRWLSRLPLWLYRAHLGWLLGHRFLLLTHTGRKSGLKRQTLLEVVRHDRTTGVFIVASGWGEKADWLRNIEHRPDVMVQSGHERLSAAAMRLPTAEAAREFSDYTKRHPAAARALARLLTGERLSGTEEDYYRLAANVPLVALRPKAPTM